MSCYFVDKRMRDENPIVKVHMKEIEKDKVKLGEAPKSMHFRVSPYIFSLCCELTLPFCSMSFGNLMNNFNAFGI
jgi:hypothetical protein